MPTSTYVSFLIRSHLRSVTPLPTLELEALKRGVAEISAIGRNLNQIARAVNQGERPSGPRKADCKRYFGRSWGCAFTSRPSSM